MKRELAGVSWARLALLTVMMGVAVAPLSGFAQTAVRDRVSISVESMDLVTASQALMKKAGIMIVVEPTDQPFSKVTLNLVDVSPEDALRSICEAAGASFRQDDNGVYMLSHKKPGSVSNNGTGPASATGPKIRKRIRVMKADPKAIYDSLLYASSSMATSPFQGAKNYTNSVGQKSPMWFGDDKTPFEPRTAPSINATSYPMPANGITLPVDRGAQLGGGGGLGQGGGGLGQGGGGLGQGGGGLGQGGGGGVTLAGGQGLVPAGISYISYDPTDNSFIVEGTDEAIQELIRIINEFDEAPRAVVIKVEFVTTSTSLSNSLGFESQYARGGVNAGTTPGAFVRGGDPVFLNFGSGNVVSRMRAQVQEGHGTVVNAPSVRTLNNQPAAFFTSVQTTIFINQVVGTGNGSVIVVPQPVTINVSTGLVVSPRINGDGTITLSLSPQIQDFGQLRRGPDGQEIPDILSQQINVVARVKNDEPVVIGGLTRKSDQGSGGGVPILGDLPIVGQFFKSTTKDKNHADLLIFVTAHVIDEGDGG